MLTAVLSILPAVILSRRAMRRRTSGSSPLSDRHVRMDVGRRKLVIHALFGAIGSVSAGLPPPAGRAHSRLVHAPGWQIPSPVSPPPRPPPPSCPSPPMESSGALPRLSAQFAPIWVGSFPSSVFAERHLRLPAT